VLWPQWATSRTSSRHILWVISAAVAELSIAAGKLCRFSDVDLVGLRRSALVHDLGRVAIPAAIWLKPAALTADEWERVRLHAYHSERVLCRSAFLASLAPTATAHHERLDGSGYHRGAVAAGLTPAARLLAAADAYHAMTEPRPLPGAAVATRVSRDAQTGGSCRAARRRQRGRRAGGRRSSVTPRRTAGRIDRSGSAGGVHAGSRFADQAGCPQARDLGQDRRPPRPERLCQDRLLHEGCRGTLRHAVRPRHMGRTPDVRARRRFVPSMTKHLAPIPGDVKGRPR
jgi:HD domain